MNEEILIHHGIKGQKWGVRRFQNADGSLTVAGRKRYAGDEQASSNNTGQKGLSDKQKNALKTVGKVALIAGSAAAIGYAYASNKDVCDVALKTIGSVALRTAKPKIDKGKAAVAKMAKEAYQQAKQGAIEGAKEAPKKVAKAAVEGAAIIATKKLLEATIGKEQMDSYTKAYNAYNKKNKIGQVDTSSKKKDEDDDDD